MPKNALLLVAAVLLAGACASTSTTTETAALPGAADTDAMERVVRLAAPEDAEGARSMLEGALIALDEGRGARASSYLSAILRSDQLTDKGRANVYWLSAEAFRLLGDEPKEAEALQAFLVAQDVVQDERRPDRDLAKRAVQARAWLLAKKVQDDPRLGKSPADAITVEDEREASAVVANLGCGPSGDGRYVEVQSKAGASDDRLLHRRAACDHGGAVLELWFAVDAPGAETSGR